MSTGIRGSLHRNPLAQSAKLVFFGARECVSLGKVEMIRLGAPHPLPQTLPKVNTPFFDKQRNSEALLILVKGSFPNGVLSRLLDRVLNL